MLDWSIGLGGQKNIVKLTNRAQLVLLVVKKIVKLTNHVLTSIVPSRLNVRNLHARRERNCCRDKNLMRQSHFSVDNFYKISINILGDQNLSVIERMCSELDLESGPKIATTPFSAT